MNFFLKVNGKFILLTIILLITGSFFFLKNLNNQKNYIINNSIEKKISNDIINPKFTLNNKKEIIEVTADKGNFISDELIMLKKNVQFNSEKFKIYSNEVLINNSKQTAESKYPSKFLSKNTEILAEGFNITESGNKIQFNGKTKIFLNK